MLRDVLLLQKRELANRLRERYVERDVSESKLTNDLIKVIIGPRRAGKSFFAMQQISRFGRFGYVNFDDERLAKIDDYDELVTVLESLYENPKHLLLDEVQNLPDWELFANRLQRQGYDLTITGSNAHLLSSELATHLTGRHVQIVLFTFSFTEYLRAVGEELTAIEMMEALRRYSEDGGYPEPMLKNLDRRDYLSTLLRSTLYKDIVVRHRIRSPQGLEDLATYLMSNIAQEYSLNRLRKLTHFKSVHTVDKYLRHLEEALLFFSVRRFSYKLRNQVSTNRKIYCTDNGLVSSTSFRFSPDLGKFYENLVAVDLRKTQLEGGLEFYFWKSPQQEEVDFVIKRGLKITELIQVCVDTQDPKTRDREIRALLKASKALNCDNLLILTENVERDEDARWHDLRGKIRFVPLWKWFGRET